ncbi:hypothetical protein Tco_0921726 [Tanacetum coccineum]
MSWRHSDSVITDPKPAAGSYSQADVQRLSDRVVKLCDMPEGVALDQRFKRRFIMILGLLFRGFPSTTPPAAADVAIPDPTPKDLAAGTPSVKVMVKAEAFKKRKASTFGSAPSYVSKCTRSAIAHSSGSTSWPSLFVQDTNDDESDDEDAYPIGDAIDRDFFPFAPRPYYATYPEDVVVFGSYKVSGLQKQVADLNDKVTASDAVFVKAKTKGKDRKKKIKSLSRSLDHATAEVARLFFDLNQARNIEAKKDAEILRLRASPPEFASFFQGGFQVLVWKFLASDEFSRFQGELLSLAANGRMIEATPLVATIGYPFINNVVDHATHPLFAIIDLEPDRLTRLEVVPLRRLFICPVMSFQYSSIAAVVEQPSSEKNEEWVCAMVDMSDDEIMDGVAGLVTSAPSNIVVPLFVQNKAFGFPLSQDAAITASVGTRYAATVAASSGV